MPAAVTKPPLLLPALDRAQVEAWRARGRVPLGVDITALLLETALCDASFWSPPAAAAATHPAAAAVSQQQLRMQYAAAIVR